MSWIAPLDTFLTDDQMMSNGQLVVNHFIGTDWKQESLAALIGNMCHESSMNPNMHELGYNDSPSRGYGLVQWTPMTKYTSWCAQFGYDYSSGDSQLARIDYEVQNNIQWIAKAAYGYMSFSDFRQNTSGASVDYLTEAFMNCYERPSPLYADLSSRQSYAHLAYSTLNWSGTVSNGGNNTGGVGGGAGGVTSPNNVSALNVLIVCDALKGFKY